MNRDILPVCRKDRTLEGIIRPENAMQQAEARAKLAEGAFLIALDVPQGVEYGIDMMVYQTGASFKGVKMVPAGLHFVHIGTGMGEKQGFFFYLEKGKVLIQAWDPATEEIGDVHSRLPEGSQEHLVRAVLNNELDRFLAPYPFDQLALWRNMSNCVTETVLQRADVALGDKIEPGEPEQIKDTASLAQHLEKQNREHRALQEQRAKIHQLTTGLPPVTDPAAAETMGHPHPTVQEQRTKQVKFTDLDARQYDAAARRQRVVGSTGSSISDLSVFHWDKSQFLEMLLQVAYEGRWEELLGELQLAFLLFLNLYSFPALNQWKKFVDLLCRAEGAVAQRPDLFVAFIRILHTQLNAVPSDFFENELSKHNFLAPAFSSLFQALSRNDLDDTLLESRHRFLKFVQNKFNLFEGNRWDTVTTAMPRAPRTQPRWRLHLEGEEGQEQEQEQEQEQAPMDTPWVDDLRYNLDEEDMPVIVSEEEATIGGASPFAAAAQPSNAHMDLNDEVERQDEEELAATDPPLPTQLSLAERDTQMYGWRYPALYDYMMESGGKEDLVMTAARVLDQIPPTIHEELAAKEKQWESAKDLLSPASRQDQNVLYTEVVRLRFLSGAREQAVRFLEDDVSKRTVDMEPTVGAQT